MEDKIKEAQENLEGEELIEFNDFIKSNPNNFFIYKDNDEIKWTTYEEAIEKELYKENSNNPLGGESYKTFNNFLLGNGGTQQDVYKKFGINSEMYFNIPKHLEIFPTKDQEYLNSLEVTGKIEEAEELINTPGFFKNHQVQMGIGCHAYNLTQETDEEGNSAYYLYNPHNQGFPVKISDFNELLPKVNMITIINVK